MPANMVAISSLAGGDYSSSDPGDPRDDKPAEGLHSTLEEVRAEVCFLIDTFDRPEGGRYLAAWYGILPDTLLENIEAFMDEALVYGERKRARVTSRQSIGVHTAISSERK